MEAMAWTQQRSARGALVAVWGVLAGAGGLWAQPADLDAWLAVRTPHVTLATDAAPARAAAVAATLERFRAAFAQLAPGLELETPAPTRIIAFRDSEHYAPYRRAGGRGVRVLGQFLSSPDGNLLTLDADPGYVGAFAVIYHEYVHYLVDSNLPDVPRWFNEGLAEYYSSFRVEGEQVHIGGPVPRAVRWLAKNGVPPLDRIFSGSPRAKRHDAEEVGDFYAGSWLLVHYLLAGDGERLDKTAALLARLAAGADAGRALEEIFDLRMSDLAAELAAHLGDGNMQEATLPLSALPAFEVAVTPLPPAEMLVELGELAARVGDRDGAVRHFDRALAREPRHAGALAGLAWVDDLEARFAEAEVLYRDALRLGTEDPVVYLRWGRHLLRTLDLEPQGPAARARADRARQAFRRVSELDPSFAEGWAMQGIAQLAPGGDPADGIASLVRAIDRLPARLDLVVRLVSLEVRAGRFERAQARVEGTLAGRADPATVAAAREEVERGRLLDSAQQAFDDGRFDQALGLFDQAVSVTSDPVLRERLDARLRALRDASSH